tara:strand:- start:478 stop:897 length:420 start_codon:yes stop_codon:yes gene_type:complete
MFKCLDKYKNKGQFEFRVGDKLSYHCKNVPNESGVYLIYTITDDIEDLVYIGASGKIKQDGTFPIQKLKRRLQNMQESGLRRQTHFENQMNENIIDEIRVRWYVTFDDEIKHLPLYVEAVLFQEFFEKYKQLPKWNKQA